MKVDADNYTRQLIEEFSNKAIKVSAKNTDDSGLEIKSFIQTKINESQQRLRREFDEKTQHFIKKALAVPDLVGEGKDCPFNTFTKFMKFFHD